MDGKNDEYRASALEASIEFVYATESPSPWKITCVNLEGGPGAYCHRKEKHYHSVNNGQSNTSLAQATPNGPLERYGASLGLGATSATLGSISKHTAQRSLE